MTDDQRADDQSADGQRHEDRRREPAGDVLQSSDPGALGEDSALERALRAAFGEEPDDSLGAAVEGTVPGSDSSRFGKYRIEERIGQGGMGEVYSAFDETLQRKVALKSILAEFRLEPRARGRFLREARSLSALNHPGICQIFDYVEAPDRDWLVLEWIDGKTLSQILFRDGPLPFKRALAVAESITDALATAHAEGIVHRDLKPGNLMVTGEGEAKVLDFGLSRARWGEARDTRGRSPSGSVASGSVAGEPAAGETAAREHGGGAPVESAPALADDRALTQDGMAVGTLPYMSPEQARGEVPGAPSDVFSLGLVLREWFTGRPAYDLELPTPDLIRAVTSGTPEPVTDLDRNLVFLLDRMTDPIPSRRPTAHGVLRRLRWIRAKPFRRRMWALGAAVGLAAVASGVKYAVDVTAARDEAVEQRGIAEDRAEQAQVLLTSVHEDLRPVLEELGRVDLLRNLGDAQLEYFPRVAASELSEAELRIQAAALYQIGSTFLALDDLELAESAFERSLEQSTELAARASGDLKIVYDRGQAEAYLGMVSYLRGDLDAARPFFEAYLASCEELVQSAPNNPKWRNEIGMARSNLATIQLEQGDVEGALPVYGAQVAEYEELLARGGLELEEERSIRSDLADQLGWLGLAHRRLGATQESLRYYEESLDVARRLIEDYPEDQRQAEQYARALNLAIHALWHAHDQEGARQLIGEELSLARSIQEQDPSNLEKQRALAATLTNVGRLYATAQPPDFEEARLNQEEAIERLRYLVSTDETNVDYLRNLAHAELSLALTWIEDDEPELAAELHESAAQRFPAGERNPTWADQWGLLDRVTAELERVADAVDSPPTE